MLILIGDGKMQMIPYRGFQQSGIAHIADGLPHNDFITGADADVLCQAGIHRHIAIVMIILYIVRIRVVNESHNML